MSYHKNVVFRVGSQKDMYLFIHTFLCFSYFSQTDETGLGMNLCYGFIPRPQTAWENECREKREEDRGRDKYREV